MEEAHDLLELKELISRLGLKDERRQSPRYNVKITGHYHAETESARGPRETCWLVDVSREGLSVRLTDNRIEAGTVLHLELPRGGKTVGVSTRVVHVQPEEGFCIVGLKSTGEGNDIIKQLFGTQA